MKRLLVTLGVFALVLTACGAGAPSAVGTATAATHGNGNVPTVAAARKHAAERKAKKLLREYSLPAGTEPLRYRRAGHGPLSRSALSAPAYGKLVQRHGFWQVQRPFRVVLRYVKRHAPEGFELHSRSRQPGVRRNATLGFRSHRRLLAVTLVAHGTRTTLRVDAGAVWIYPRSPQEVLPAGVTAIDIVSERATTHVTDSQQVARIVAWFDALGVVQPGEHVICPLAPVGLPLELDFRSSTGTLLARALAPSIGSSTQCTPIQFSIGGRQQTPLVGGNFVLRVENLLGVRF